MDDDNKPEDRHGSDDLRGVAISPVEVMQQKFSIKFRGYDTNDVENYLELIAKELETLLQSNGHLREKLKSMQDVIAQYKQKEDSIHSALVTVQKMADDVKRRAAEEAERILSETKTEAQRLMNETHEAVAAQREEASFIRQEAEKEIQIRAEESKIAADKIKHEAEEMRSETLTKASEIKAEAESKAESIVDRALQEAHKIHDEAAEKKTQLEAEIDTLRQRKRQFQASLRALIDTHMKLMETDDS